MSRGRMGPPGDPSSPIGYVFSPDYGATWSAPEIAITSAGGGVPNGIVADENWVHLMVEQGIYVRRRVLPVFRSIRRQGQAVILEWMGTGTLQSSAEVTGPWEDLAGAISPQTVTNDLEKGFFRLIAR